jgi:hypothetical protein
VARVGAVHRKGRPVERAATQLAISGPAARPSADTVRGSTATPKTSNGARRTGIIRRAVSRSTRPSFLPIVPPIAPVRPIVPIVPIRPAPAAPAPAPIAPPIAPGELNIMVGRRSRPACFLGHGRNRVADGCEPFRDRRGGRGVAGRRDALSQRSARLNRAASKCRRRRPGRSRTGFSGTSDAATCSGSQ